MVKLRNPWGNDHEWNGDWSDKSTLWDLIPKQDQPDLNEADGIFWMNFADFSRIFGQVAVCEVDMTSF